ncbi:MAG: hypothetical protein ACLFOC_06980 [Campylobacterales bacterium]
MDYDKLNALKAKIEMLKFHDEKMSKIYSSILTTLLDETKNEKRLEEAIFDLYINIDRYFKDSGYHKGF